MESVNQQVWRAIRTDPALLRGLQRKLVNMRALAKYIINEYGLNASLDAVISSIRRFPINSVEKENKIFHDIFKDSVISTTNNIACATISGSPAEILSCIVELSFPRPRVVTGNDKVKVLVKTSNMARISEVFKDARIENGLSEIAVTVADKAIKTKGVMARIAAELALANINIQELLVCPPQFLIYVSEKDIVKAHERVLALTQ